MSGVFPEDTSALDAWAQSMSRAGVGPSVATKFPTGQSNPTYLIENPSGRYVLGAEAPRQTTEEGAHDRARISA